MPSRHGNALPAGLRLGEYELLRVLGEGGFGIVYLAQDHTLRRRVAIKEYMPASLATRHSSLAVVATSERQRPVFEAGLQGFINEARLLAQFDHPALLKVYRFWSGHGTAYMVMPFYEGVTLKDKLKQMATPPGEAWLMMMLGSLTEALSVVHAGHCLHRDIAPDNILLLADSGQPLLLDFGAARQVIGDATQALTAILKPGYAPVEQYAQMPDMRQGPWTDVYALCAVVYAAVMGRKPPVAVARTVKDAYEPLTLCAAGRYSHRFLQAIDDGLRLRPDERTASIGQLRQALGLESGPGPATASTPPHNTTGRASTVAPVAWPPAPTASPATSASPAPPARAVPIAAPAPRVPPATPPAPVVADTAAPPTVQRLTWASPTLLIGSATIATLALAGGFTYWASQRALPQPAAVAAAPSAPTIVAAELPVTAPLPRPGPVAPPAAPALLSVQDEFERVVKSSQADFQVKVKPAQSRLRIGRDRLSFTISTARAGYVYVLVAGADGSLLLFYPNSMAAGERLLPGRSLTLPQAHWGLDTTEPAGAEHFLVIISEHPRDFSHLSQERETWFQRLPTGSAGAGLAQAHSGAGSVIAGKARCGAPGCDAYGADRFTLEVVN